MRFHLTEKLFLLPIEYIVDGLGGIEDPEGMTGIRLEVNAKVIAGQAAILENITESVEQAGLFVEGRILEPIAAAKATLSDEQTHRGVMLIDIGGQITQVVIFYEGAPIQFLWVPVGGMHVTNDIAIGMKVPFEEAEAIKRKSISIKHSSKDNDKFVLDIINARLQEVLELIESETREARNGGLVPCGVVFAGEGSLTPGIPELACEILDLPAQIGESRLVRTDKGIEPGSLSQVALGITRHVAENSGFIFERESQPSVFMGILSTLRGWFDEFLRDFF